MGEGKLPYLLFHMRTF